MTVTFQFKVEEKGGIREISYDVKGAVLCGYTGRDQSAVRAHIEELKKEGIESPPSVPTFYPKPPRNMVFEGDVIVEGRETSGEVEYVLLLDGDDIYVGVGSDHTDREMERIDILKSKQVCPAVFSKNLWNYNEIKSHWDQIEIRSMATKDGESALYQESTLGTILAPEELLRLVQQRVEGSLEGIAIFSGTPPLKTGQMVFADRFECELSDPILNRKLTIGYTIQTLSWFKT